MVAGVCFQRQFLASGLICCLLVVAFISCSSHDSIRSRSLPVARMRTDSGATVQLADTSEVAPGVPYMGKYHAKPLPDYAQLPERVRTNVERQVIARTGDLFFRQLRYAGGGFVDLDSLYIIEKDAKNFKWKPRSYYLCFELYDPVKEVRYGTTVETDIKGNILSRVEFPDIRYKPEKAHIISKQETTHIAVEHHVFDTLNRRKEGEYTEVNLKYDADRKIFFWEFERTFDTAGHASFNIYCHRINAHNGKYLGCRMSEGIH